MEGSDRGFAVDFFVLGEEDVKGFAADRDGRGGVNAFGGVASECNKFRSLDTVSAHEGHIFETNVSALFGETSAFSLTLKPFQGTSYRIEAQENGRMELKPLQR